MTELETIGLEPVESLTITTLVDNVTDILLLDEGPAIRAPIDSRAPRVASRVIEGGQTLDALRAEHGFAALVTISHGGREHRVLFDRHYTRTQLPARKACKGPLLLPTFGPKLSNSGRIGDLGRRAVRPPARRGRTPRASAVRRVRAW